MSELGYVEAWTRRGESLRRNRGNRDPLEFRTPGSAGEGDNVADSRQGVSA